MNRIRPEEMISVRNRRYPSGIDRIRCLKPLTFVIDVMNVDGGDERLTVYPDAPIQNGSSSFRWQNETRSNLPNLADTLSTTPPNMSTQSSARFQMLPRREHLACRPGSLGFSH